MRAVQCVSMGGTLMLALAPLLASDTPTFSGGLDVRASYASPPRDSNVAVRGAFLNVRQVWGDAAGDRWIGVAQVDVENDFEDVRPYQVYLQYKGPLGRWNIRAGHYLLPFGLLANYDTERLLLRGLEETSLGIRHDTGAETFGRMGDWDYAVSVTDGLSDILFSDSRANPLFTARAAYVKGDWQVGFSTLAGRVWSRFQSVVGEGETSTRPPPAGARA